MLSDSRTESQSPVITSACFFLLEYHKHLATEVLVEQTTFHSPVAALDHESVNTRIVEIYQKTAARVLFPLIGRGILGVCLLDVGIMLVQPGIIGIFFAFLAAIGYVVYLFGLDAPSVRQESSFAIAGYVMSSAAAVNFIRCLLSGKPLFVTAPEQIGMMILLSVVCVFMAILFYAIGVRLIGPGNAALVNTLEPVLACIFGYFLVGDLLTGRMLIGAALVVIAVLITNLPDKSKS